MTSSVQFDEAVRKHVNEGQLEAARTLLARAKGMPIVWWSEQTHRSISYWDFVLSPVWWADIKHRNVLIRRPKPCDAGFLNQCKSDTEFLKRYSRRWGWHGDLERALKSANGIPPVLNGSINWVVEHQGLPQGLASLAMIDQVNRRAEFTIGFPLKQPPTVAHKAALLVMHFSFWIVGLHKLYTYVYEDNRSAQKATRRLGFLTEGVLADHFWFEDTPISVTTFGLTKTQACSNEKLLAIVKRLINQDWKLPEGEFQRNLPATC